MVPLREAEPGTLAPLLWKGLGLIPEAESVGPGRGAGNQSAGPPEALVAQTLSQLGVSAPGAQLLDPGDAPSVQGRRGSCVPTALPGALL